MRSFRIDMRDEQKVRIPKTALKKAIKDVLERERVAGAEVSVYLVGLERMQELNRTHRGLDEPTDVLSFPLCSGRAEIEDLSELDEPLLLGDVVICPAYILGTNALQSSKSEASGAKNTAFQAEVLRAGVHGALHLLGYDHEAGDDRGRMKRRENVAIKAMIAGGW